MIGLSVNKNIKSILVLSIMFLIVFLGSCVNPVEGPPPDELVPTLNVYSPNSNDTVFIGQTNISYEAKDDNGISYLEVFINDKLINTFEQPQDSEKVDIYLDVDLNLLRKRIKYHVLAYDFSGNVSSREDKTNIFVNEFKSPPIAPGNLVLNKISDQIYNLIWADNSDDELYFELWRKEDTSAVKMHKFLPKNSISINDTIPFPNLTYSYLIKAVNEFGSSESNVVSTAPDASGLILAPSKLLGTAYGTSRIKLIWKDNSDNELAFNIERKIASGNNFESIGIAGTNDTIFYDTEGLFPSSSYTYRVAAIGQFGLSKWSNTVTVATLSYDNNPPSNLQSNYNSVDNVLTLEWNDNSIFEIETRVERSGINKIYTEIGIAKENEKKYADSTISVGSTYFYRVRYYTVDGLYSEYSEELEVKL